MAEPVENQLPDAFKVDQLEEQPVPSDTYADVNEDAVDSETGLPLNKDAMPTNVVDPYNLRYKPHPALQYHNVVPFANFDGQTLSEDRYLYPARSVGLTEPVVNDSDQPQTPEEALQINEDENWNETRPNNQDYESGANGSQLEPKKATSGKGKTSDSKETGGAAADKKDPFEDKK